MFKEDRIVVPSQLQKQAVKWHHQTLMYPGETRTKATIAQHFYWLGLRATVRDICTKCHNCQLTKKHLLSYGKVPPKQMPEQLAPWHTLCIDLIGPHAIGENVTRQTTKNKIVSVEAVRKAPILWCMTMINPATNWFEIV